MAAFYDPVADSARILSYGFSGDPTVYFVYALIDPRTDRVRYIGCTKNPVSRFAQHLNRPLGEGLDSWFSELSSAGLAPRLLTLTEVTGYQKAIELESIYIYEYQGRQDDLLNRSNRLKSREKYKWYRFGTDWRRELLKSARPQRELKQWTPRITRFGSRISAFGKSQSMAEWARELGISRERVRQRLIKYPPEIALSYGKQSGGLFRIDGTATCEPKTANLQKPPRKVTLKGFSHEQRRERRRQMAEAVHSGRTVKEVAAQFDVVKTLVAKSLKEFHRRASP